MFNWFRKKVELKNENSIMASSSFKRGIKIGSEIDVPQNFKCLIFNNGKYYFSLDSGKHKVTADKFERLIFAQSRTRRKKHVRMICHYINLSPQSIIVKFKKEQYLVKFSINEPLAFANLILLYAYKVDHNYTLNTIHDVFAEALSWLNGDYSKFNTALFNGYGIQVESCLPKNKKQSIFNSNDNLLVSSNDLSASNPNVSTTSNNQPQEPFEQERSSTPPPEDSKTMSNSQFNECPKCKNITKFNTTYCLRCGHKLE